MALPALDVAMLSEGLRIAFNTDELDKPALLDACRIQMLKANDRDFVEALVQMAAGVEHNPQLNPATQRCLASVLRSCASRIDRLTGD